MIKGVVNTFSDTAKEKNLDLLFISSNQNIPSIKVDKARISEVLSNLISNAIKYTEPWGQIKIWSEISQTDLITHVKDSGHGITPEAIPQLFNKFFRVSGTLEKGSQGTGLGLYIAKSLVQMHHGKIWVQSEINKGSTFSFSLPLS